MELLVRNTGLKTRLQRSIQLQILTQMIPLRQMLVVTGFFNECDVGKSAVSPPELIESWHCWISSVHWQYLQTTTFSILLSFNSLSSQNSTIYSNDFIN